MQPFCIAPIAQRLYTRGCASIALVTLTAALFHSTATAQGFFGLKDEDPDNPWEEAELSLPPPPSQGKLRSFDVSANASHTFSVDEDSLSIGADNVIRYTLVIESQSGARNVSYEGIRCDTREYKQFAYGKANGEWSIARASKWQAIRGTTMNRYHHALAKDFFCDDRALKGGIKQIQFALRNQQRETPL